MQLNKIQNFPKKPYINRLSSQFPVPCYIVYPDEIATKYDRTEIFIQITTKESK